MTQLVICNYYFYELLVLPIVNKINKLIGELTLVECVDELNGHRQSQMDKLHFNRSTAPNA